MAPRMTSARARELHDWLRLEAVAEWGTSRDRSRKFDEIADFIRDSPAPKLAVPEPPLTAMELDLDEGALHWVRRIENLEGLMAALQDHKALTKLIDHGKRLDGVARRLDGLEEDARRDLDNVVERLERLEQRHREEDQAKGNTELTRMWLEWYRIDPAAAERWRQG